MSIQVKLKVWFAPLGHITVRADVEPGTPNVYTLPNGDPGYPGDPAELEIVEIRDTEGKLVDATDEQYQALHDLIFDRAEEAARKQGAEERAELEDERRHWCEDVY